MTQRAAERNNDDASTSDSPLEELIRQNNKLLDQLISEIKELNDSNHFVRGQVFEALRRLSQGQRRLWHAIDVATGHRLAEPPDEVLIRPPDAAAPEEAEAA